MPHCQQCGNVHGELDACPRGSTRKKTEKEKCDDIKMRHSWQWVVKHRGNVGMIERIAAEFKASFLFALIAIGSSLVFNYFRGASIDPFFLLFGVFFVGIAHGYGLFVSVAAWGGLSADMNLSITLMRLIPFGSHQMPLMRGLLRILAQFVGWILAGLVLLIFFSASEIGAAGPSLNTDFSTTQGFFSEFFGTFGLTLVVYMMQGMAGQNLAAGQALTAFMWILSFISGGSFNIWRWFIPAIINGFGGISFSIDFIYLLAPLLGSFVAWICWIVFFDMTGGSGGGGGLSKNVGNDDCATKREFEMFETTKDPIV